MLHNLWHFPRTLVNWLVTNWIQRRHGIWSTEHWGSQLPRGKSSIMHSVAAPPIWAASGSSKWRRIDRTMSPDRLRLAPDCLRFPNRFIRPFILFTWVRNSLNFKCEFRPDCGRCFFGSLTKKLASFEGGHFNLHSVPYMIYLARSPGLLPRTIYYFFHVLASTGMRRGWSYHPSDPQLSRIRSVGRPEEDDELRPHTHALCSCLLAVP